FACHDSKKRKGKLDMTTYESFRKGGDKDDPIAPGKPDESQILDRLKETGAGRMPPKESGEPLPPAKIAVIEQWIKEGAKVVAGGRPGQEGDVRVYNLSAGSPKVVNGVAMLDGVTDKAVMVKQLLEADDSVLCLAVSNDGKKLASGGCDRMVHVWNVSGSIA